MITFVYGGSVSKSIFLPFELQCIRKELPVVGPVEDWERKRKMKKRKVIIDCDPGIDDSLAIMLALQSEELEIVESPLYAGTVR